MSSEQAEISEQNVQDDEQQEAMDFDEILESAGPFGRYQILISIIPMLLLIAIAMHSISPVFLFYIPQHRCWTDESAPPSNESFINLIKNSTMEQCPDANSTCNSWIFDRTEFYETFATQHQLVCDQSWIATTIKTCFFAGFLVGVTASGLVSDFFGRRKSMLIFLSIFTIFEISLAFAPTPILAAIATFCSGIGSLGTSTVSYVLLTESFGAKRRFHVVPLLHYSWNAGVLLVVLAAYLARHWQRMQIALSVTLLPLLAAALVPQLLPESPRWLLTQGRLKEAKVLMARLMRINRSASSTQRILQLMQVPKQQDQQDQQSLLRQLMKHPKLLLRCAVIFVNWFVTAMVYYGLTLGSKNLPGNVFFTALINGLVEVPAYIAEHVTVNRLGRKKLHIIGLCIAGVSLTASLIINLYTVGAIAMICLSMVGKFAITAVFSSIYLWTIELYPTSIRSSSLSFSSMCARLGTLCAPVLADVSNFMDPQIGLSVTFGIFACTSLMAAAISLLLPETQNVKLMDTVEEMLNGKTETEATVSVPLMEPSISMNELKKL